MKIIRRKKGQSMAEFVIVLPVFMLLALGLIQLSAIFLNMIALKYAAFMTARTAAVYENQEIRLQKAGKAFDLLKVMIAHANSADKNPVSGLFDAGLNRMLDYVMSGQNARENENTGLVSVEKEIFKNSGLTESGNSDEIRFIRVTVTYKMPLKVPFVNRIFGLFQSEIKFSFGDLIGGRIFSHDKEEWIKYGLNKFMPYYTIRAVSIMRVG